MNYFSIRDLENFSGIKAHTIRTWEQRFDFLNPLRSEKQRRTYSIEEVKLLLEVSLLNANGYKVSQIARFTEPERRALVHSFTAPAQKQHKAIHELIVCTALLDAECFDMVLDSCVKEWGIDSTLENVLVPYAHKMGMLEAKRPAQHTANLLLMEESVRHKLIMGIDKIPFAGSSNCMLLLPLQRGSELTLLYLQYKLKQSGYAAFLINSLTKSSDLKMLIKSLNPKALVAIVPEKASSANLFLSLKENGSSFSMPDLYLLGTENAALELLTGATIATSVMELEEKLSTKLVPRKPVSAAA